MSRSEGLGIKNLRLKYPGEDVPLLFRGISLSVEPGEKVLLLGPSGCGKSTLLQVLSGIVPDIVEIPLKAEELRTPSRPGYVFQDPDTQFCMPYVDEEIAFVLENLQVPREQMPALIDRYLEMAGLRFDDTHTPIGQLSQGMKQRLAIASVLALEPDVLFLDEPTALLDEEGTEQVWDTIRTVCGDKTLVIVEHKISGILDFIDRLIVIGPEGQLLADGRPQDIFSTCKQQLMDYGIWYPGVWDEVERRQEQVVKDYTELTPVMTLRDFSGLRGRQIRTSVDNLSAYPGDWIAVTGANGAGKSSLLLAIMRLIPIQGTCWIEGVKGTKVEQLAERVAFVFQNPEFQFVTHSVEDEIAYSLPEGAGQEAVEALLRQYDLHQLRNRHPFQLSMGQKRRLSVASALVRQPRVLLLDEPTFGLDARNTFRMLELLEQLRASGTAIVMVTHDSEIVSRYATRVWRVEVGEVKEAAKRPLPTQAKPFAEGEALLCN
ncbi:ABC transporter ATP-binding protein [Paenibacillus sp. GCM10027628]|uniref:ABC transporter ATP-binding protein n=1 Tax=Paenibacillus sp. GCM10027628 TaxID=3273413 RepID=UPI00363C8BA4